MKVVYTGGPERGFIYGPNDVDENGKPAPGMGRPLVDFQRRRSANPKNASQAGGEPKEISQSLGGLAKTFGLIITSGYRSVEKQAQLYAKRSSSGSVGRPGKSWHNSGRAIDVSPDAKGQAFLRYAFANPSQFKEVFYDPAGISIKNGKIIQSTIGGHSDHIHIAM